MHNHSYYRFDEHHELVFPGSHAETIRWCVEEWIKIANESIRDHKFFAVALSGGSTPKKIYEQLAFKENVTRVDWGKVFLFWSDERSVSPDNPDSNYSMAFDILNSTGIPQENIFRMMAERDTEKMADAYQDNIQQRLKKRPFDLIMLGMGDDGHTASLFPHTEGLHEDSKLVIANYVPQKKTMRMTFTYLCINAARYIHVYVLGKSKAKILETVFVSPYNPNEYPIQKVGTKDNPALFIVDEEASQNLLRHLESRE